MNTEFALLSHLLNDPSHISSLALKGFNKHFFKNKNYGKAYDLIFDRWTRFKSVPTSEDLKTVGFERSNESIPHTVEHCTVYMLEEKIKEVLQKTLIASGELLVANGPDAAIEIIQKGLSSIPRLDSERRSRQISETTDAFLERFHNRALHKDKIIGVETGFPELDSHVRGLMPQWLVVIQGRNGQYKSWVLSHWVKTMFLNKKNVALFSCEMSLAEFETRIHSLALDIQPRNLDLGDITSGEYNRMQEYLQDIKDGTKGGKLLINDNPGTMENIYFEIDQILEKHPLDAICIDAVYELSAPGQSRNERYEYIAKECKNMAKKYEIPVIVTIQANRDFAKANTGGKKETAGGGMSAYGSDAWNQVADLMFIIHQNEENAPFHFSEFIMDKFRHGAKKDMMLKINLKEPVIQEVDREKALAKIKGENPTAQANSDNLFNRTTDLFKQETTFGQNEITYSFEDEENTGEDI